MTQSQREQAKALYLQGISKSEIARRLGVVRRTIIRWCDDGNWDAFKLSEPAPTLKPTNLVSFDRPRQSATVDAEDIPLRPRPKPGELDLVEIVEGAIADAAALIEFASKSNDTKGFGGTAGGLVNLIKLRREMGDDEALAKEVLKRYKTPGELREFFVQLKGAEWGGKGA